MPAVPFYSMFVYVDKTVYCILACLFFFPDLYGQSNSSSLRFEAISRDLGTIREADGSVFQTFTFANTSSDPLRFGRNSPSCSCIKALFTQETYESGEVGEIIIRFNPAGEKGKVYRYVDIYSHEGEFLVKLSITADVIPNERNSEEQFRHRITDNLLATSDKINMGYIPLGGTASKNIFLLNNSSGPVQIIARPCKTSSIVTIKHPCTIAPGEIAGIEIAFRIPDDPDSYGIKKEVIEILVNGVRSPFQLYASCICTDRFDKNESAIPDMVVSPSLATLKKRILKRNFEGHFTIENRGSVNLLIRAVEKESDININIRKGDVIRPGEQITIRAESTKKTFNVFLITNDPARPVKEIRFNYEEN